MPARGEDLPGDRRPAEREARDRGDRDGDVAVRGADPARADGEDAAGGLLDAELPPRLAGPDHVGQGVQRPDLVEVDLVGRDPVGRALRVGEAAEDRQRQVDRAPGDLRMGARVLEHRPDRGPGAVRRVVDQHLHVDLHRALPAAVHVGAHEAHRVRDQRVEHPLDAREVRAGVDERGQQHVAGDPGGRVDKGGAGRGGIHDRIVSAPPPRTAPTTARGSGRMRG